MNLINKYDQSLHRRMALRAIWLPGTEVKVGDILHKKDGALISIGNIRNFGVDFNETFIAKSLSLNIVSRGVRETIIQNNSTVDLNSLIPDVEAELKISFDSENSYMLKTPQLSGTGMQSAISVAHDISQIPRWDYLQNYIVHKVWRAKDFTFLGSIDKDRDITFRGSGEVIYNIVQNGISSELEKTSKKSLSFEMLGKSGPIVMQVFRVKRKVEIY